MSTVNVSTMKHDATRQRHVKDGQIASQQKKRFEAEKLQNISVTLTPKFIFPSSSIFWFCITFITVSQQYILFTKIKKYFKKLLINLYQGYIITNFLTNFLSFKLERFCFLRLAFLVGLLIRAQDAATIGFPSFLKHF